MNDKITIKTVKYCENNDVLLLFELENNKGIGVAQLDKHYFNRFSIIKMGWKRNCYIYYGFSGKQKNDKHIISVLVGGNNLNNKIAKYKLVIQNKNPITIEVNPNSYLLDYHIIELTNIDQTKCLYDIIFYDENNNIISAKNS
ncbi:hypothetical protein PV797_15010 [Clostridiaceae bacterium M8S5]|nr:hypothetical protein PV797_15010 [Clostridiaceae bacterium M8S5]